MNATVRYHVTIRETGTAVCPPTFTLEEALAQAHDHYGAAAVARVKILRVTTTSDEVAV